MELAEAIKRRLPLQVRLPDRQRPLETAVQYAAEVFLVETAQGPGVVWLDPFWCDSSPPPPTKICHISYAKPWFDPGRGRWVDQDPRYGPRCLAWQKPFLMERLEQGSPAWGDYKAWKIWSSGKAGTCGRRAAWRLIEETFGELILKRLA